MFNKSRSGNSSSFKWANIFETLRVYLRVYVEIFDWDELSQFSKVLFLTHFTILYFSILWMKLCCKSIIFASGEWKEIKIIRSFINLNRRFIRFDSFNLQKYRRNIFNWCRGYRSRCKNYLAFKCKKWREKGRFSDRCWLELNFEWNR